MRRSCPGWRTRERAVSGQGENRACLRNQSIGLVAAARGPNVNKRSLVPKTMVVQRQRSPGVYLLDVANAGLPILRAASSMPRHVQAGSDYTTKKRRR